MKFINNFPTYLLTDWQIEMVQLIQLKQRIRSLSSNLDDTEVEEIWRLLHEEPEYADEILDGYEKLIRDRRIQWIIDHLPEKEGYMMENAVYTMPEYVDEILDYWENRARNDDDDRGDDGDGWEDVGWDDDDD